MLRCALLGMILVAGVIEGASNQPLAVPFFGQQKNGCGAASVAMVIHYWANHAPNLPPYPTADEAYQRLYDHERNGILLGDMKRYFEEYGFKAFTFRGRWADVEVHLGKGRPVIVALKLKPTAPIHYVVITGAAGDHVTLNDSTRRRTTRLKRAEFERQWSYADQWMLLATPQLGSPSPQ